MTFRRLSREQIAALTTFAFCRSRDRSVEAQHVWRQYKNCPHVPAHHVDLSDPRALSHPWLTDRRLPTLDHLPENSSVYDYALLSLCVGDRVRFDDREFRLGHFVGAGNSTHIYRLLDAPDRVIRLPFMAPHLTEYATDPWGRLEIGFDLMNETVERARGLPRSVFLHTECDRTARYAIAAYVNGTLGAESFLAETAQTYPDVVDPENGFFSGSGLSRLSDDARDKAADLIDACRALLPFFPLHTNATICRNLLWSDSPPCEWKLVDIV